MAELEDKDIPSIAKGALREALLNYPVPRHMGRIDCQELLRGLLTSRKAVAVSCGTEVVCPAA